MIGKLGAFIGGFIVGRLAILIVLLIVGLIIAGAQAPEHTPGARTASAGSPASYREVRQQGEEEEQRQREYAAKPGPPYPVKGWLP